MKTYFIFLIFGFIQLKIQFEWTKDTLARRPSDLVYENHYKGQDFSIYGEFSKNAFAIVNLLAPSDLFINQMVNINVNAKINNEITVESPSCYCNAVQGNGFLLCDFKNINKEIDSIQILDNKENDAIEFDLKDFNTWVEICNGIYGNDNNNNNNNNNNINNITTNNDNEKENNLSKGAIAGITISSIVIVGGIIFITYKIINKNKIEKISIKINKDIIKEKSENINISEKNMESTTKIKDEDVEFPKNINQENIKKVIEFLESKVGCGYAFGAEGQILTENLLNDFKSKFKGNVKESTEKWLDKECYDCSGLVMKALDQAGIKVHHNAEATWAEDLKQRGDIKDIPKDKLCLVFRRQNDKMVHIGVYLGNGKVIEAKGADFGVVESDFKPGNWTHWGIPARLE